MTILRRSLAAALLLTALCRASTTGAAESPRVELLAYVSVAGDRILLSDLLPQTAPDSWRADAAAISLGAAPQPGASRTLERNLVERSIESNPVLSGGLDVPERIVVSRTGRAVTVEEVLPAVRAALASLHADAAQSLRAGDLEMAAPLLTIPGDPGLRVTGIEPDAALHRTRFRIAALQDPNLLPFFVTAAVDVAAPAPAAPSPDKREPRDSGSSGRARSAPSADSGKLQQILISRGAPATLTAKSDALEILVDVVALESGTLGQRIAVRISDTGKVVNAVVQGPAQVAASF